jgi:hypothetical protein
MIIDPISLSSPLHEKTLWTGAEAAKISQAMGGNRG